MTEWIFIIMMTSSVALFSAGGTGFKWLRRFVLPGVLALCLFFLGVSWWQSLLAGILLINAFVMPYGDSVPAYWLKFLIFCMYSFPSLVIGWSIWAVLVPVLSTLVFWLSNWKPTAKAFTWKICEALFGFLVSLSLIGAYLNKW
jgi:hypothetical protein